MAKFRRTLQQAPFWQTVTYWLQRLTEDGGGYVSLKQPAPPGIRKLHGNRGQSQPQDL